MGEQRREAEQGGATAARHPWGHGRGASGLGPRGNSRRRLGPRLGLVTSNSGWPWHPASLLRLWVPESAIRGHFEGRGRPRRRRLHPRSWRGRSSGREEPPPPPTGAPCRICAASGSRTCGPGTRRPPAAASRGLPRAKCCVFQLRGPAQIRTRSRVQISNTSLNFFGFGSNPTWTARLPSCKSPAAAPA